MIVDIANRLKSVEEYYFSKKLQEISRLTAAGVSIINLGIGKPDIAPEKSIIKELQNSSENSNAHGYQPYKGIPALRESMASFYRKHFNVNLDPTKEILPLMGSKEGIMHLSMAFLNPGDEVLIPNPGYPSYASAAKLAGGIIKEYDLLESNDFQFSTDQLDKLVTERTKLMWVNYPHMPTGTLANPKLLESLISWAKANKILLCSDCPYSFILNESPFSLLSLKGAKEVCVELNSLSKSHGMSGWRIGMALGNQEIIEAMLRFKSNMDSGMFLPIQHAASKAMQLTDSWYSDNNKIYFQRRNRIWKLLDDIGFQYRKDSAGLFVWSKISGLFNNGEAASDFFLENGRVFVPPGMVFGHNGQNYVRWSLCQPIEIIEEACQRIQSVM